MRLVSRHIWILLIFLALFTINGCVTANFTEPITSFQNGINTSSIVLGTYYAELNDFERNLYLDDRLYNSSLEVLAIDKNGLPTALLQGPFNTESIKARTDALLLLGVYANRLGELAGTKAPAEFASGATALGNNLSGLQQTFLKLGKDDEDKKLIDETAKNYAEPIGTIIGVIGRMYLESTRDQALTETIKNGDPAVNTVLDLLEKDIVEIISPQKLLGLKELLAERVNYYNETFVLRSTNPNLSEIEKRSIATHNEQVNRIPFSQREKTLDEIESVTAQYQKFKVSNPTSLVQSMRTAHNALVTYARSRRTPEDFTALITILETFKNNVNTAVTAVQQIQEL